MIWGTWVDPNFKFKAEDSKGIELEHICYSPDEAALRQTLSRKRLKVISITPYDFGEWKRKAAGYRDKAVWTRIKDRWSYFQRQASDKWPWLTPADLTAIDGIKKQLIKTIRDNDGCSEPVATTQVDAWTAQLEEEAPAAGQILPKTPIKFNDDVWRELKWHLFDLFHEKCAYCETKPLGGDTGAVEHYRPKGKVDEDKHHPGYYWLAYDETNLLPSCASCNEPARAKRTRFPVDGAHAREARSLSKEVPFLLNPYDKTIDPFDHLEFDAAGASGTRNNSKIGDYTRDVYDLDRHGLAGSRYDEMQLLEGAWSATIGRLVNVVQAYAELRNAIAQGDRAYSAAQLWALDRLKERTISGLRGFSGPAVRPAGSSITPASGGFPVGRGAVPPTPTGP